MVPPLTDHEYSVLKQSVTENGFFERIKINKEKVILDGHHRYKVWKETGVTPKFECMNFDSKINEIKYVIKANLERRQLNIYQRSGLVEKLEELESDEARKRQGRRTDLETTFPSNEGKVKKHEREAASRAARAYNISPTSYYRSKIIREKGTKELKDKVASGEASINWAYNKVTRIERHTITPDLPIGEYDVIYADPPWDYFFKFRGNPENHYPTMKTKEICGLKIPSAENSVLFLWSTNPKLEEAIQVINSWGFTYKTNLVWVKDKIGTGHYVRGLHELLLICVKGSMPTPMEHTRPASVLNSPTRKHSQKPDELYKLIEELYPNRSYIELFARNNREGWVSWGNEV